MKKLRITALTKPEDCGLAIEAGYLREGDDGLVYFTDRGDMFLDLHIKNIIIRDNNGNII